MRGLIDEIDSNLMKLEETKNAFTVNTYLTYGIHVLNESVIWDTLKKLTINLRLPTWMAFGIDDLYIVNTMKYTFTLTGNDNPKNGLWKITPIDASYYNNGVNSVRIYHSISLDQTNYALIGNDEHLLAIIDWS